MRKYVINIIFLILAVYILVDQYNIKNKINRLEKSSKMQYEFNDVPKKNRNIEYNNSLVELKDLDSINKRLFALEKKLILRKEDSNGLERVVAENEEDKVDLSKLEGVEKAEAILEIGKKNGEFTMKNIRMINAVMRNLSESEREQVKDDMMELIQSGKIEMPRPHPSTLKESDGAIDMKELPDDAVMVSP